MLLLSHGSMAEGVLDTCQLFFPDGLAQVQAIGLYQVDSLEVYEQRILEGIHAVNDGAGVLVLCDLLGGTPANCSRKIAMKMQNDSIQFIAGYNLAVVLEFLGLRLQVESIQELHIQNILDIGTQALVSINQQIINNVRQIDFVNDFFEEI